MTPADVARIERAIGYTFRNRRLLETAFTHASYVNEHRAAESYEKLEFLGDAILNFIIAEKLFFDKPTDEGEMTEERAKIVSRKPLDEAVQQMEIFPYMRFGRNAQAYASAKTRSDLFESLIAAIYLDAGRDLDAARAFVDTRLDAAQLFIQKNVDGDRHQFNYRGALQIYVQAHKKKIEYPDPERRTEGADAMFFADVVVDGVVYGKGVGHTKQGAKMDAARIACEALSVVKAINAKKK